MLTLQGPNVAVDDHASALAAVTAANAIDAGNSFFALPTPLLIFFSAATS
jgi:hypothetical protein